MEKGVPGWLRVIFILVAAQALLLVVVFFNPGQVNLLVPWPATPLNARFIASLYTSLGLGVLICAFARSFYQVRIVLFGIAFATLALLILTIPQFGTLPKFPLWWTVFYIVDPILVAISFWRLGWGARTHLPNPLAPVWIIQAVIFGLAGLFMLIFPAQAVSLWPWSLTVPLSQMYSLFFIALAVGSLMALDEPRWDGVRILTVMFAVLALLVLGVSIYHFARFKSGLPAIIWFVFVGIEILAFLGLQFRQPAQVSVEGAKI